MDFLSKIYSNIHQEIIQISPMMALQCQQDGATVSTGWRWHHDGIILNRKKVSHDDHELLLRAERQIATVTEKVDRMVGEAQEGFSLLSAISRPRITPDILGPSMDV